MQSVKSIHLHQISFDAYIWNPYEKRLTLPGKDIASCARNRPVFNIASILALDSASLNYKKQ